MLLEKFNADIITAMKAQDQFTLTVLRMLKGAMKQEIIDNKKEEDDTLLIECTNKQIKIRKESIANFKEAGRDDLVDQNEKELAILEKYLPEQLSAEEVEKEIEAVFAELNPSSIKDMGLVMKELQVKLNGKTDMKKLSEIVKAKLS